MKSSNVIRNLLYEPERMVEKVNLKYITEDQLTILRKRRGKGFSYLLEGKCITQKEELQLIKKLVILPAWNNVKISSIPNSHLQVVGIDLKERKQYQHHTKWSRIRKKVKFYKMIAFGKKLPLNSQ